MSAKVGSHTSTGSVETAAKPLGLSEHLPGELFQPSYTKATWALCWVVLILTTGYVGLAFAPWYVLPIGWLIVGTSITGLASVANDCERQIFVKSKFLNHCLGMICLLPLCMPFNTMAESASSNSLLDRGPFWILRSLWQWVKANFALPVTCFLGGNALSASRKTMLVNLLCLYAFVCAFFPILTMTLGFWGLFKYYIIPMCVYHFWMSTCLKLSDQVQGNSLALCSYPAWVEFLGNNFNQVANSMAKFRDQKFDDLMPSYNVKTARKTLQDTRLANAYQEIKFGWSTFFGDSQNKKIIMKIHNDWYDFTTFKHPGGPVALGLGNGRDATALFYAHHPFTSTARMDGLFNKYRIPQEELAERTKGITILEDEDQVFDWDKTFPEGNTPTFARELISEVRTYFEGEAKKRGVSLNEAIKATPRRWTEMIVFFGSFLVSVYFYTQGYWFSLITTPVFAWLYAAAIAHDAMHFSISTNWKINSIMGYLTPWTTSPLMWYHQHVIGHHAYPNVPFKDPDLAHAPGFMRLHQSVRWKPAHKYQLITMTIIWTLGGALYMTLVPLKAMYFGALNRAVFLLNISRKRAIIHVMGRILTALMLWGWQWYVFQGDLPRQILFTFTPILIHSLCFMFSTQFNHLTPQNIDLSDKEYYAHQVITAHSFSMRSQLIFWITGGLNVQIEHHLFPTVNHCHLLAISPIVQRLCAKYNVAYHESKSLLEAVSKHVDLVRNMSQKTKTQ